MKIFEKKIENFLWNFWKKLKFYVANISQKSCVFKWIFKKMILKIFYDVNFLEKNFKLRFLEIVPLKNLVFNWICSQIYHSLGPYWSYSLQMKKVLQSFQTYCVHKAKFIRSYFQGFCVILKFSLLLYVLTVLYTPCNL